MTMTPQPQAFSFVATGQYGSLGNTAWELVGDPTISVPSTRDDLDLPFDRTRHPRSDYDPIVISFDNGDGSTFNDAVYNFAHPATASVSASADGYATSTGSGWYLP